MLQKRLFSQSPSAYQLFDRARRRTRPLYESDQQKHLRERSEADYLLLSLTNCGETWLRVMLGRAMQLEYASDCLQEVNLQDLYSFSERLPTLPAIKPMHEKFGQWGHTYAGQKVILLVRDPRDAAISRYHQHQEALRDELGYEKLDRYVCESDDFAAYIQFYNDWQNYRDRPTEFHPEAFLRIRYEDLSVDTFKEMKRIVQFLGLPISDSNLRSAINDASFHNSQKDAVGRYTRELSSASINFVDEAVTTQLDSTYGYGFSFQDSHLIPQLGKFYYSAFTTAQSNRLKISVIAPDLAGGGTTRVYLVANALQRLGHHVTVVGAQFSEELYPVPPENLNVYPIKAERSLQYIKALKQILPTLDGDVLYTIKPRPTSLGTALIKKLTSHKPLIVDIDDWEMSWVRSYRPTPKQLARDILKPNGALRDPEHPAYMEWMEKLVSHADAVTVTTQFLQDKFGGYYLPNGKDTALFNPAFYDPAQIRARYGLSNYRVLMFPGTVRPHKGLEDVLVALDQLNEPDFRLVIVGGRKPDSYEDDLLKKWGRWLIKLPRFPINAMAEIVSAAHIVVVPQRDYATAKAQFPLKLTDGMSMAKPIISTRVGDIPDILKDSGYLVDPESPEQIAAQIKHIFANPEEAMYKGRIAHMRCVAHYSTARMGEVLEKVLHPFMPAGTSPER